MAKLNQRSLRCMAAFKGGGGARRALTSPIRWKVNRDMLDVLLNLSHSPPSHIFCILSEWYTRLLKRRNYVLTISMEKDGGHDS